MVHSLGRQKKGSRFFGHPYAILISTLVVGAGVYSLYTQGSQARTSDASDPQNVDNYINNGTLVLSNEFNYGFGKTPEPDAFPQEVPVTVPKWLSLDESVTTTAQSSTQTAVLSEPDVTVELTDPTKETFIAVAENRPRVAIIIDDMGVRQNMTRPFAKLSENINFSFLPYAEGLKWQTQVMREAGHELMLHLPMEPSVANQNPGPKALMTNLSDNDLQQRLNWNLARFEGFVGINNHMGSLFTQNANMMSAVVERLKQDGLFFIDSRTTSNSAAFSMAKQHGLKYEDRDVFLDNILTEEAIFKQFDELEKLAHRNGVAIAIGHPHRETLEALEKWLPTLEEKGIEVVKVSSILRQDGAPVEVLTTNNQSPSQNTNPNYSGGGN